jgi:uroporphyrinogen decarboxylase
MTTTDRAIRLLEGETVDRTPLFPFILGFCAKNAGYPIATIYSDAQKSFELQSWTHEQYGFDWGPIYGYASYGTWEFGGEIKMPTTAYEQAPSHTRFPVNYEEDVSKLQLPDPKKAGILPISMEFSRLQEANRKPISIVCGGNFTIAGNVCPVETLCRWMLKKPDLVHHIMRMATDHIVDIVGYWCDTFGAERVIPQLWEPLAANVIISPKQFEKFVLPYTKESSEKILCMGVKHILYHICGDQNKNLPYWNQIPMGDPGLCSFGLEVDLLTAIEYLGSQNVIIGNIDPKVYLSETPEHIYGLCRRAIEKGRSAPRGFMLSSGCEIPPEAPPYHVYMMHKAVKDSVTSG